MTRLAVTPMNEQVVQEFVSIKRRHFLQSSASALSLLSMGAAAAAESGRTLQEIPAETGGSASILPVAIPPLARIEARADRIITMNVCTRPFRAQGPRLELERLGRKTVVHNYGHGGSGWSLSWGSARVAVDMALTTGQKELAVIGCGAIGLTTAIVAQQAGLGVTIYAKERPPYVRSSFATGVWSPESRVCTLEHAAGFAERWETMTRYSHRKYQTLLGLKENAIEYREIYNLSDDAFDGPGSSEGSLEPEYPEFTKTLVPDLDPKPLDLSSMEHPFAVPYVRRSPLMLINISAYSRLLLDDFHQGGGKIVSAELKDNRDFASFDERTIINCTGYGARELLGDDTITPVRGQTAKMIPQPDVTYGIRYSDKHISVYPRRDGILVQAGADSDYGNPEASVDPDESISAVNRLAEVMAGLKG